MILRKVGCKECSRRKNGRSAKVKIQLAVFGNMDKQHAVALRKRDLFLRLRRDVKRAEIDFTELILQATDAEHMEIQRLLQPADFKKPVNVFALLRSARSNGDVAHCIIKHGVWNLLFLIKRICLSCAQETKCEAKRRAGFSVSKQTVFAKRNRFLLR